MLGPVLGRLRSHLGSLIEELVDPWLARCESELRERRGAERQRDAGACPRSTTWPSPTACSSPRSTYASGSRTPDPPSGVFDYAEVRGSGCGSMAPRSRFATRRQAACPGRMHDQTAMRTEG